MYPVRMTTVAATWSSGSCTKPNAELSTPQKGATDATAATAMVEHNSSPPGLLAKKGLRVLRMSIDASWVRTEITNHEV